MNDQSTCCCCSFGWRYKLSTLLNSCWQFDIANPIPKPAPVATGQNLPEGEEEWGWSSHCLWSVLRLNSNKENTDPNATPTPSICKSSAQDFTCISIHRPVFKTASAIHLSHFSPGTSSLRATSSAILKVTWWAWSDTRFIYFFAR